MNETDGDFLYPVTTLVTIFLNSKLPNMTKSYKPTSNN